MLFDTTLAALVAALAFGTIQVDATWRMSTRPLAYTRVDPIVDPKKVGGHVHDIRGGSRFRDIVDTTQVMLAAKCSTIDIQQDKSNYWTPSLYYINPNGTYSHMLSDVLIYYNTAAGSKPVAFPDGMRMLTGMSNQRDIGSFKTQGISWAVNAREPDQPKIYNPKFMPNGTNVDVAPRIVSAHAFFPSCGLADGSIDSDDHFSHMTWPVGQGGHREWIQLGNSPHCPSTHPIKYPEIHIETFFHLTDWQQKNWRKGEVNLIISNGDTTGAAWHGDFVNGWDGNLLQQALNDATCLDITDPDACPTLNQVKSKDFVDCRWEGQLVDEDVGVWTAIDTIPGCNAKWDWDGPMDKPTTACTPTPGYVSPVLMLDQGSEQYVPIVIPKTSGDPASMGGCSTPHDCPVFHPWAVTMGAAQSNIQNVSYVQVGTQAEVDANVVSNDSNNRMKIPGLDNDNDYTDVKPTKTFGGPQASDLIMTMTSNMTYYCEYTDYAKYPYGMACPAEGGDYQAIVTPTGGAATPTGGAASSPAVTASGTDAANGTSPSASAANGSSSGSDSVKATASLPGALNAMPTGATGTPTAAAVAADSTITSAATDATAVDPASAASSGSDAVPVIASASGTGSSAPPATAATTKAKGKCRRSRRRSNHASSA